VARSFTGLLWGSVASGLLMTLLGLALSYRYDLPSGATIILVGAVLLGVLLLAQAGLRSLRHSTE
jgi:ABC-type Mn2+/Zn2+ transport system permease subunit